MKTIFSASILLIVISHQTLAQGNISVGSTTYPYVGPAQYGAIGLPRGEIMFSNTNTQNQLYFMQNGFMSSSGLFQYRNSSVASAIGLDNGNIFFFTAPAGTANANIPLAARLIMGNDGNMRMGTLNSTAKGRLHIGAEDKNVKSAISIRQSNADPYGFDIGLDQSLNGNMFLYRVAADVKNNVMEFDRNNGNVGIGTSPSAKLAVHNDVPLGTTAGSNQLLMRVSGKGDNYFMNNLWLRRDANGFEWWTTTLHDGISIEGSFLTPGVDTRTWWERHPFNDIQKWGNNNLTYMSLIGGYAPNGTVTTLAVKGRVHANEVKVDLSVPGPDYVFEKDYKLPPLNEIKSYIDEHKHLPEVPSAKEMEKNGVQLGEMNMLLLKKVEELTLYLIEQQKQNEIQSEEIKQLKQLIKNED
ncbi:MAG: hypothetical protein K2U26_14495 [Cyclobacteriaceae bacterium]|nr:hypothetical protein [Cyclobacteriaceae bacterium]